MFKTTAKLRGKTWPVTIKSLGRNNYIVSGRSTELRLAIRPSHDIGGGEWLVAELNYNRCGCLNAQNWHAEDIQQYIGLENLVDAATLAAALNILLKGEVDV
jgi:hypothetical protein